MTLVSVELLAPAYRALGRHTLAEIAELHYRHRDLAQVTVLGWVRRNVPP